MGHHKENNQPLGLVDFIAAAVCFIIVAFLVKALITTAVPGLLTEKTFYQILQSGFLFILVWSLFLNRLFHSYLDAFEQREKQTSGAKKEVQRIESEIKSINENLEIEIQKARFKALQENENLIAEAKKKANQLVAEANSKATNEYEHSLSNILAMKKKAEGELDQEVTSLSSYFKDSALKLSGETIH